MKTIRWTESLPPSPATDAVLFIGSHPTVQEESKGEPFSSPSGQLVRQCYTKSPFKNGSDLNARATIYFTNAVRCNPNGQDLEPIHLKACKFWLDLDIQHLKSIHRELFIVYLGAQAVKQSLNMPLKDAIRGNPHTPAD